MTSPIGPSRETAAAAPPSDAERVTLTSLSDELLIKITLQMEARDRLAVYGVNRHLRKVARDESQVIDLETYARFECLFQSVFKSYRRRDISFFTCTFLPVCLTERGYNEDTLTAPTNLSIASTALRMLANRPPVFGNPPTNQTLVVGLLYNFKALTKALSTIYSGPVCLALLYPDSKSPQIEPPPTPGEARKPHSDESSGAKADEAEKSHFVRMFFHEIEKGFSPGLNANAKINAFSNAQGEKYLIEILDRMFDVLGSRFCVELTALTSRFLNPAAFHAVWNFLMKKMAPSYESPLALAKAAESFFLSARLLTEEEQKRLFRAFIGPFVHLSILSGKLEVLELLIQDTFCTSLFVTKNDKWILDFLFLILDAGNYRLALEISMKIRDKNFITYRGIFFYFCFKKALESNDRQFIIDSMNSSSSGKLRDSLAMQASFVFIKYHDFLSAWHTLESIENTSARKILFTALLELLERLSIRPDLRRWCSLASSYLYHGHQNLSDEQTQIEERVADRLRTDEFSSITLPVEGLRFAADRKRWYEAAHKKALEKNDQRSANVFQTRLEFLVDRKKIIRHISIDEIQEIDSSKRLRDVWMNCELECKTTTRKNLFQALAQRAEQLECASLATTLRTKVDELETLDRDKDLSITIEEVLRRVQVSGDFEMAMKIVMHKTNAQVRKKALLELAKLATAKRENALAKELQFAASGICDLQSVNDSSQSVAGSERLDDLGGILPVLANEPAPFNDDHAAAAAAAAASSSSSMASSASSSASNAKRVMLAAPSKNSRLPFVQPSGLPARDKRSADDELAVSYALRVRLEPVAASSSAVESDHSSSDSTRSSRPDPANLNRLSRQPAFGSLRLPSSQTNKRSAADLAGAPLTPWTRQESKRNASGRESSPSS